MSPSNTETTILKLYVKGNCYQNQNDVAEARRILEQMGYLNFTLEIIDVEKDQDIIRQEQIMVIPMLVKTSPIPERRFVGNLSDAHPDMLGLTYHAHNTQNKISNKSVNSIRASSYKAARRAVSDS